MGTKKLLSDIVERSVDGKKKVRSDRMLPALGRLSLDAIINNQIQLKIMNLSETGVALKGAQITTGDAKINLRITLDKDKILYDGIGQIRWTEKDEGGDTLMGVSFTSNILDRGIVKALDSITSISDDLYRQKNAFEELPADYKEFIFDYKNFLRELKLSLDNLEEKLALESFETRQSYYSAFEILILPKLVMEVNNFNRRLDQVASKIKDKKSRKNAIDVFQKEVSSYITPSPFTYRALKKPLGHAGDYEMMNQIYRNASEGKTLFDKVIHKAGVNEASSQSVRFRRTFLKEKIKNLIKTKNAVRIASIACGPAKEIVDLVSELSNEEMARTTFVLVDQELEALLNAKREILSECLMHEKSINIEFTPQDIRGIIEGTLPEELGKGDFDLIYSAGLFDYLLETPAKILAMNLLELIKSEGTLLIGNFHPDNPTKTISEFSVNWKLFHRTEDEMLKLIPEGFAKSKKLIFDDGKIEIFIEVKK